MTTTQTQGDSREPRTLTLDRYSEQTRRDLYDLVVEMQFSPIEGAGPDDDPRHQALRDARSAASYAI